MKYFITIILLVGIQSCGTDSGNSYETKVLSEIFDSLIKEMGVLSEFEIPFPPQKLFFDDSTNIMKHDTIGYKKEIDEIEKKNKKMRDTTFVIAVFDTLFTCNNQDLNVEYIKKQLKEQDYIEALNAMKNCSMENHLINLSEIGNRRHLILKYYSDFPKGFKIWERENYDFLFSGVLRISRIYFDKKREVGLFYSSYACGRLCGEQVIICIRKIRNKWSIEKTILLGVS